jgi:hypothetical protein
MRKQIEEGANRNTWNKFRDNQARTDDDAGHASTSLGIKLNLFVRILKGMDDFQTSLIKLDTHSLWYHSKQLEDEMEKQK